MSLSLATITRLVLLILLGDNLEKLDKAEIELYSTTLKSKRVAMALKIPLMDISATDIRRRIKEGKSIKYLLPESIESYIIANKLYK